MRNSILSFLILATMSASVNAEAPKRSVATLDVTSAAFSNNGSIPSKYTCEGDEVAPPLAWSKVPANTKSIAILVEDPDAPKGTFTHWLVTGISPTTTALTGGIPDGAIASRNGKGSVGYAGPCPPQGRHHYQFHVYALDIDLPHELMTRGGFMKAVNGHILAAGQLVGTYQRTGGVR